MGDFDPTHHITGGVVFFTNGTVKLLLKWSKTIQMRDQVKLITLPKLQMCEICPYRALKVIFRLYSPGGMEPLFQCNTAYGWQVITDSRVRKSLSTSNRMMGLRKGFYTFHAFRCSGATLAYRAHTPIQQIKDHGTWTSECIWRYIVSDQ